MKTIKITMSTLLLILAYSLVAEDVDASQSIYTGLYTQHYSGDGDYNESNEVVQYQYSNDGTFYDASTFVNSHYIRSYQVGIGQYWDRGDHEFGTALSVIHGYKGKLQTIEWGLIIAPGVYYEYKLGSTIGVKMIVMPTVYNIGFNYAF